MGKCRNLFPESVIAKVKDYVRSLQVHVVQTSCTWRGDLITNFKSFANGIKVSSRNAASEIYSELIYFC